jgi:hypothetical protein
MVGSLLIKSKNAGKVTNETGIFTNLNNEASIRLTGLKARQPYGVLKKFVSFY